MPFVPSITISQSPLAPAEITATDASTGSDGAITARRIFFQTSAAIYLKETGVSTDYNLWPLANSSQTFNVLLEDKALLITVNWVDVSGVTLYTYSQLYCLDQFNKQFFYYLIGLQAMTPTVLSDNPYSTNMARLWVNIKGAEQSIEIGADISGSQACLNRATALQNSQTIFY